MYFGDKKPYPCFYYSIDYCFFVIILSHFYVRWIAMGLTKMESNLLKTVKSTKETVTGFTKTNDFSLSRVTIVITEM